MNHGAIPSNLDVPVPRAYCIFDSTAAGANPPTAGINIATITRNGAGDYTVAFTGALGAATYAVCVTCDIADRVAVVDTKAAGTFNIKIYDTTAAATLADAGTDVSVMVMFLDNT